MHRRELEGSYAEDRPRDVRGGVSRDGTQGVDEGVGPLLHRTYAGAVDGAGLSAEELIGRLAEDPNRAAPGGLAKFRKVRGEEGVMQVGDEYVVRMPGPWDGPVRVVEVTPGPSASRPSRATSRRAKSNGAPASIAISSSASSPGRAPAIASLLHHKLLVAKEVQLHMWTCVVEEAAGIAGGRLVNGVNIETRVVPDRDGAG